MYALLSLYDKPGSEKFARSLIERGYSIVSSGGTAKYLVEHGIKVTDIAEITGLKPVLDHRVVTLAPQVHAGLLATPEMRSELEALGWPKFHLLYVTFYPLEEELNNTEATFDSCIKKTDIGGTTMIRSACKGGDVIVLTDKEDEATVLQWIDDGKPAPDQFMLRLRKKGERAVANYVRLSAQVYDEFDADGKRIKR